jgi:penicillin-binding protein 1A
MPDEPLSIISPPPIKRPSGVSSRRIFGQFVFLILLLLSSGIGALVGLVFVYSSDLPKVYELEDYRPDVMTELYADDGTLVGSFALERRVIVTYNQIPQVLRDAVLSIEDRHFESHWGIDVLRIVRAGITDLLEWRKAQGASTLTQQLGRKLFLTPEKSFRRKFQEVLLAIQIERHFTKQQIFSLYANQVDLGHGNFGFEAAAQFYFGKHLDQLTLPEAALLAGIPQRPPAYSPISHPEVARRRRNQVLAATLENGKITPAQYREAVAAPLGLNVQRWGNTIAPYFVEDIRQSLEKKYGPETVHEKGLRVYTTLNVRLQKLAETALRQGLHDDDKRRGWRGPEKNILKNPLLLPDDRPARLETYVDDDWKEPLEAGARVHGLVMEVKSDHALVRFGTLIARVTPPDFAWTKKAHPEEVLAPGDLDLFVVKEIKGQNLRVTLDQRPNVQGALVAIENATGAIRAMVGGYDWNESKYNCAVQAERQVGSSFKIYVYAQALSEGMSPFETILDAPVSYSTSSGSWSPRNFDLKYEGNITLLHALADSRNVPAVRLLAKIGVDKVIKLCRKFGVTSRLVPNLPLALGASDLTLLEHTSAFTVFPNDGVHIAPRMIYRVTNYDGRVIDDFPPEVTDVLPVPVARLMVSMLREVINSGTSTRAKALKRPLAGKTGTTNEFSDAWFIGFSPSLTCGVWVGFDDHRTLGPKEEGSHVALPIWMDFMGEVLKDQPVEDFPHSPLLTNPEQVQEILASAAPERLLAEPSPTPVAGGNQPSALAAGQTTLPGAPTSQTAPASAPGELQSSTSAGARSPSPPTTAQPAGSPGRTKPPSNAAPEVPKPSTATSGAKPAPPPAPSAKTGTIPPSR